MARPEHDVTVRVPSASKSASRTVPSNRSSRGRVDVTPKREFVRDVTEKRCHIGLDCDTEL